MILVVTPGDERSITEFIAAQRAGSAIGRPLSDATLDVYERALRSLAAYLHARGVPLLAARHADLGSWDAWRVQQRAAPGTRGTCISAARRFFAWAVAMRLIAESPATPMVGPRVRVRSRDVATPAQVAALLGAIDPRDKFGARDLAMVHLLCATGLKTSDVAALRVADVAHDCASVTYGRRRLRVELPAEARDALGTYLATGRPAIVGRAVGVGDALFLSHWRRRMARQAIWKRLVKYGDAAGVVLTPRGLRNAFTDAALARERERTAAARAARVEAERQERLARIDQRMAERLEPGRAVVPGRFPFTAAARVDSRSRPR